jgi:hypothetical protein
LHAQPGLGGGGGAGNGTNSQNARGQSGLNNTGGGAGGSSLAGGATGGSGIVILRYPSFYASAKSTTGSPNTYTTGFWRVYEFIASGTITF